MLLFVISFNSHEFERFIDKFLSEASQGYLTLMQHVMHLIKFPLPVTAQLEMLQKSNVPLQTLYFVSLQIKYQKPPFHLLLHYCLTDTKKEQYFPFKIIFINIFNVTKPGQTYLGVSPVLIRRLDQKTSRCPFKSKQFCNSVIPKFIESVSQTWLFTVTSDFKSHICKFRSTCWYLSFQSCIYH